MLCYWARGNIKKLLSVLLLFHDPTYKQRMLTLWELLWQNCLLLSSLSNVTHKTLRSSLSWTMHWNKCQNIVSNKLDNWGASLELKIARGAISTYCSSVQISDRKPDPVRLRFRLFALVQELPGWSFSAKETNMIAPFLRRGLAAVWGFRCRCAEACRHDLSQEFVNLPVASSANTILGVDCRIALGFLEAFKSTCLEQCCIDVWDNGTGYIDGLVHYLASKKIRYLPNPFPKVLQGHNSFYIQQPLNLLVGHSPGK